MTDFKLMGKNALLETILHEYEFDMGNDAIRYKNHCYRMLNYYMYIRPGLSTADISKAVIAAAFHDIGVWSHKTADYLDPSIQEAAKYLRTIKHGDWVEEVSLMIEWHHKMAPYTGKYQESVEAFRQADVIDFTKNLVRYGMPRIVINAVNKYYPVEGFYGMLMRGAWEWFKSHPFKMPPFMRK